MSSGFGEFSLTCNFLPFSSAEENVDSVMPTSLAYNILSSNVSILVFLSEITVYELLDMPKLILRHLVFRYMIYGKVEIVQKEIQERFIQVS